MEKFDLQFDIYDPSYPVDSQYWQLGLVKSFDDGEDWRLIGKCINRGLPLIEEKLFDSAKQETEHSLWGCIYWNQKYWIYRFFLTGRDQSGRPGRYFFVLFKIDDLNDLNLNRITEIVDYLAVQTSIPLNLKPLPSKKTEEHQFNELKIQPFSFYQISMLLNFARTIEEEFHIALLFKQDNLIREHKGLPLPADKQRNNIDNSKNLLQNNKKFYLIFFLAGLIIGLIIGFIARDILYKKDITQKPTTNLCDKDKKTDKDNQNVSTIEPHEKK